MGIIDLFPDYRTSASATPPAAPIAPAKNNNLWIIVGVVVFILIILALTQK